MSANHARVRQAARPGRPPGSRAKAPRDARAGPATRLPLDPAPRTPEQVIALQRLAGNRSTSRLVATQPVAVAYLRPSSRPAVQRRPGTGTDLKVWVPWRGSLEASLMGLIRRSATTEDQAQAAYRTTFAAGFKYVYRDKRLDKRQWVARIARDGGFTAYGSVVEKIAAALGIPAQQVVEHSRAAKAGEAAISKLVGAAAGFKGEQPDESLAWQGPTAAASGDWSVLEKDPKLAAYFLKVLQHYGGLNLTPAVESKAAGGLTRQETMQIVGTNARHLMLANRFTEQYVAYKASGGAALSGFSPLLSGLFDQLTWGNPTAARNQLLIGKGWPEKNVLGIKHRPDGMLYYDGSGIPLYLGGVPRDKGYVGSQVPSWAILNIGKIEDPALRALLNALRLRFTEPTRMVASAAQVYFDNIEVVNAHVRKNLPEKVVQRFADMLPVFVGFLLGHGVSTLLMRVPNPVAAGVGAALKGLLIAAGYVMQIDFLGTALNRLLESSAHLVRVQKTDAGKLTDLSLLHIAEAARPIQSMVIEVASSVAVGKLAGLLRGGKAAITCSKCTVRQRRRRRQRGQEAHQAGITARTFDAARKAIRGRGRVAAVAGRQHPGRTGHQIADDVILSTINQPQQTFVARNGNWVFYRNGVVVVTSGGNPAFVQTAFGRGGTVPAARGEAYYQRLSRIYGQEIRPGQPDPPVNVATWRASLTGMFRVAQVCKGKRCKQF